MNYSWGEIFIEISNGLARYVGLILVKTQSISTLIHNSIGMGDLLRNMNTSALWALPRCNAGLLDHIHGHEKWFFLTNTHEIWINDFDSKTIHLNPHKIS